MLGVVPAMMVQVGYVTTQTHPAPPQHGPAHRMVRGTLRKGDAGKFSRQKGRQKENSLLAQGPIIFSPQFGIESP